MHVPTLDDLSPAGATLGVRVDLNSPLAADGSLADDSRLRAHRDTLAELLDAGARVGVLAHQGRPGGDDFARLEPHADRLDALLDAPVSYCDATFSADARSALAALDDGECVVLENTRFYSEEYMAFEPADAADTFLVDRLAPSLDAYVNDAFAAAHRSQPSLVGFPRVLPGYAGRVMETELDVLGDIANTPTPRAYVLGGAKIADTVDVAEHALEAGLADDVLTTGAVANLFLVAAGVDVGAASREFVHDRVGEDGVDRAGGLLDAHGDSIHLPVDVAVEVDGERRDVPVGDLPVDGAPVLDVGPRTVDEYAARLADAGTAVLNGPAGVFEQEAFAAGTRGIFEAATGADYCVVGGGDSAAAIRQFGLEGFDHVSTGGGAALTLLAGAALPAVEALQ